HSGNLEAVIFPQGRCNMMEPETKYVSIWVVLQQLCALVLVLAVVYLPSSIFKKANPPPLPRRVPCPATLSNGCRSRKGKRSFKRGKSPSFMISRRSGA